MKKHLYLFVFLLSLIPLLGIAQGALEDVIYLKNGTIYRGTIIERMPDVRYKIEIAGGSVILVKSEEIEKITLEKSNSNSGYYIKPTVPKPVFRYRDRGYFFEGKVAFGGLTGLTIVNGYKFNHWVHLGVGAGIDYTTFYIPFGDFQSEGGYATFFFTLFGRYTS